MTKNNVERKFVPPVVEQGARLIQAVPQPQAKDHPFDVPHIKCYAILADNITLPTTTLLMQEPRVLWDEIVIIGEEKPRDRVVTEAELYEAGCNIEWLLHCEAIRLVGYKPL